MTSHKLFTHPANHWLKDIGIAAEDNRESDFLQRVYAGGCEKYRMRLENIGFTGKEKVLDAGSGFGQWSVALGHLNRFTVSLEYDESRCGIAKKIYHHLGIKNVGIIRGTIEQVPVANGTFDAVFSYSVIYQADWQRVIAEFARILKHKGTLYISANGVGWAARNVLKNPNPSADFSPRRNALKSILKTLSRGRLCQKGDWILFPRRIKKELKKNGFGSIILEGDGKITRENSTPLPFYSSTYLGFTHVFEILAVKE